jgi:hypothetical protein
MMKNVTPPKLGTWFACELRSFNFSNNLFNFTTWIITGVTKYMTINPLKKNKVNTKNKKIVILVYCFFLPQR